MPLKSVVGQRIKKFLVNAGIRRVNDKIELNSSLNRLLVVRFHPLCFNFFVKFRTTFEKRKAIWNSNFEISIWPFLESKNICKLAKKSFSRDWRSLHYSIWRWWFCLTKRRIHDVIHWKYTNYALLHYFQNLAIKVDTDFGWNFRSQN